MVLLVGLGNPGIQYALTRHNVGFMLLDVIADTFSFQPFKRRGEAVFSEGEIGSQKVMLFKPLNFMNRLGIPVSDFKSFFKIPLDDMIVIHDDLDLALGQVKIKQGGGAGGHNGLRSLDAHVGQNYWRLRIGVGRPSHRDGVNTYLLNNFSQDEQDFLAPLFQILALEAARLIVKDMPGFLSTVALRRQED